MSVPTKEALTTIVVVLTDALRRSYETNRESLGGSCSGGGVGGKVNEL